MVKSWRLSPWGYTLIILCVVQLSHQQDQLSNQELLDQLSGLFQLKMTELENTLTSHINEKMSIMENGLNYVADEIFDIKTKTQLIYAETEALTGRTSITQLSSEKSVLLQEQIITILNDTKDNITEELKNLKAKAEYLKESNRENFNETKTLLGNLNQYTDYLANSSDTMKTALTDLQETADREKVLHSNTSGLLQSIKQNVKTLDNPINVIKSSVLALKENDIAENIFHNNISQALQYINQNAKSMKDTLLETENTVLSIKERVDDMKTFQSKTSDLLQDINQDTEYLKEPVSHISSLDDTIQNNQKIIQNIKNATLSLKNHMYQVFQTTVKNTNCPEPLVYGDQDIICPNKDERTWEGAVDYCKSIGLKLGQPQHLPSIAAKIYEAYDCTCWYWIGGKGSGSSQMWLNGTTLSTSLSEWKSGHPDTAETDCLVLRASNTTTKVLETKTCSTTSGYTLCEVGNCPKKMVHGDKDSVCPRRSHKTWQQAFTYCRSLGLHLAQPKDLFSLSTKLVESEGDAYWYWLGGRGWGTQQLWLNGSVVDNGMSEWKSGYPKVSTTDCLVLRSSNTSKQVLETKDCSTTTGYTLCMAV